MNAKALLAEFIGVFALCFVGILAILNLGGADAGLIGIALAHGLVIACMVAATAHISGGHLNPAVTIGLTLVGKCKPAVAVGYIIAQILGGVVAAVLVSGLMDASVVGGGTPGLGEIMVNENTFVIGAVPGMILEAVATFFLMYVIMGSAVDSRAGKLGPFAIGLTVTFGILAIGPMTGAALNPARYLGPALIGGTDLGAAWVYFVGPILGAALAALAYKFGQMEDEPTA